MPGPPPIARFRDLQDVSFGTPSDGYIATYVASTGKTAMLAPGGGSTPNLEQVTTAGSTTDKSCAFESNGAPSTAAVLINGAVLTGGTGTTNWPQFLIQPNGVTSNKWSTSGTLIGGNAPNAFGGNLIDLQVEGMRIFAVDFSGKAQILSIVPAQSNTSLSLGNKSFSAAGIAVSVATAAQTNASGVFVGLGILPTYNQTLTAGATDILINRTETVIGSGNQYFMDFQVGGVSKGHIDHVGNLVINSVAPTFLYQPWLTLAYASTVATNGSLGDNFECTLSSGAFTLGNPTNANDGQIFRWRLIQPGSGAAATITLGTSFNLGSDLSSVTLSLTNGKADYLTAIYRSSTSKFDVTGLLRGF